MSEKTEQPTSKKLDDTREKGDVPHSKDAAKSLLVGACLVYLIFYGPRVAESAANLIHWSGTRAYGPFPVALKEVLEVSIQLLIETMLPFVVIVVLSSVLGEILHVGVIFAPEKIKPSLNKLNVINNAKQFFSAQNLLEGLKSILKVIVLTWVLWAIIQENVGTLALIPPAGMDALAFAFGKMLKAMLLATALLFCIVAGADILLQRFLYMKRNKMSKDEVKQERKDMEGDPHIKSHRKQHHRALAEESRREMVRDSTAVVVNPTHFAVALYYKEGDTPLPVVVAMGEGGYAKIIVQDAREAGVPVIQNIYLARSLISDARLDDYVPTHLLDATVEVLRAVKDMGPSW